MAEGKAYPRTCKVCGLGPCIHPPLIMVAEQGTKQPSQWAMDKAAQIWCLPSCEHLAMEPELAMEFARTLDSVTEKSGQAGPDVTDADPQRLPIPQSLAAALNSHSAESASNTPDFILGDFLASALECLNQAIRERDHWYRTTLEPGKDNPASAAEFYRKALDQAIQAGQIGIRSETELAIGISNRTDIEHEVIRAWYGWGLMSNAPELVEYLRQPKE